MVEIKSQPIYFVAFLKTGFTSIDEVRAKMPDALATHLSRSNELHRHGKVLMAGALKSNPGESVTTMAVFYSQEDAEEYVKGDPFVISGMVSDWHVEEWARILRE
jgi:uncharacterized protein YciI